MELKLPKLHDSVRRRAEGELRVHTRTLGRLITSMLENSVGGEVDERQLRQLKLVASCARTAACDLDAASYLDSKVLSGVNARVVDIRLRDSLGEAQRQIEESFASGQAPRRGFVYISWSRRPEKFLYVGKASSVARLNLSGHGKLANTIGRATSLSLIFPSRSSDEILAGVEASVLALIDSHTGSLPELNARDETVPDYEGTNHLSKLQRVLRESANLLDW